MSGSGGVLFYGDGSARRNRRVARRGRQSAADLSPPGHWMCESTAASDHSVRRSGPRHSNSSLDPMRLASLRDNVRRPPGKFHSTKSFHFALGEQSGRGISQSCQGQDVRWGILTAHNRLQ
jgi:hypothetical protein